jgi:hypothetical protein
MGNSGSPSGDSPFDVNDLFQNFVDRVPLYPFRVVSLEPPCVTDVPDVIAAAIIFFVRIIHSVSGQFFCHPNCFQQRAIRKPPSPGVVNLTAASSSSFGGQAISPLARKRLAVELEVSARFDILFLLWPPAKQV